jgi:hypothetical protein
MKGNKRDPRKENILFANTSIRLALKGNKETKKETEAVFERLRRDMVRQELSTT